MDAQLKGYSERPLIKRGEKHSDVDHRIGQILSRLENKLDEDSASSFNYEDIAFQLSDLKSQIHELVQEKNRSENIYFWIQIFMSGIILAMLTYLSSYIVMIAQ